MSDNYQAIYDAVRSRISNGDIGSVAERVMHECFDVSWQKSILQEQIVSVGNQMSRPSAIYRPKLFPDGNMWCALYGDDLQNGVSGFGKTPDEACYAFDQAWHAARPEARS